MGETGPALGVALHIPRDWNAARNMAKIVQHHMKHGTRPGYLCPEAGENRFFKGTHGHMSGICDLTPQRV